MLNSAGKPSDRDLTTAVAQVAGLTAAGLPLASGLRATASETTSHGLRNTLLQISERLDRGEALETIFGTLPHVPPALLRLLQAGERTGRLDLFLRDYLEQDRDERRLQTRILITLLYPMVLLIITMGMFTFWMAGFIDDFLRNFISSYNLFSNPPDNSMQNVLLWFLRAVLDYRWLIAVFLVLLTGISALAMIPRFREPILRLVGACLPPIREVLGHQATAGFCRLLANLVEQQIPLADALRIAGGACGSASLASSADHLAAVSLGGGNLGETALYEKPVFLDVAHAFRWHTDGRMFVQALRDSAENHSLQVDSNWGFALLERLLRPAAILIVGAFVFWVYAATLAPLIQLLNNLS